MPSKATTVKQYLAELPKDRREVIEAMLKVIRKNIDKTFEEGIQYGSIGFYVPHSVYPSGYHCNPKEPLPFAGIAATKNHIGIHLFCVYMSPGLNSWFCSEWKKSGKKLDMGKACVRVKKLEDVPLDVLGKLFKRIKAKDFIAQYEAAFGGSAKKAAKKPAKKAAKKAAKKGAKKKPAKKAAKKAVKKVTKKKAATKKKPAAKKATKKRRS